MRHFGHDGKKTFPASVTTNKKETDGRILWQVLLHHHVKQLYLYAADVPGK